MLSHPLSYKIKFTYGENSSFVSYICAINAAGSPASGPHKGEIRPAGRTGAAPFTQEKYRMKLVAISIALLALAVVMLGVKVLFVRGGRFPEGHSHDLKEISRKKK